MTAALLLGWGSALAADHLDAPGASADQPADITDIYSFFDADHFVAVVNFAGLAVSGEPATYDRDVLYGIHIDRNDDDVPEVDIWIRFGRNAAGAWGVQVQNVPGAGTVSGPVESILVSGPARVYAGLRDDPFFFDLDGFNTTRTTGTVSFDSTNDTFAGTNVTSIVIETDKMAATAGGPVRVWASTARIP